MGVKGSCVFGWGSVACLGGAPLNFFWFGCVALVYGRGFVYTYLCRVWLYWLCPCFVYYENWKE